MGQDEVKGEIKKQSLHEMLARVLFEAFGNLMIRICFLHEVSPAARWDFYDLISKQGAYEVARKETREVGLLALVQHEVEIDLSNDEGGRH